MITEGRKRKLEHLVEQGKKFGAKLDARKKGFHARRELARRCPVRWGPPKPRATKRGTVNRKLRLTRRAPGVQYLPEHEQHRLSNLSTRERDRILGSRWRKSQGEQA